MRPKTIDFDAAFPSDAVLGFIQAWAAKDYVAAAKHFLAILNYLAEVFGGGDGFGAAQLEAMSEDDMIAVIKSLSEDGFGAPAPTPEFAAVPWALLISVVLKVVALLKKRNDTGSAAPEPV